MGKHQERLILHTQILFIRIYILYMKYVYPKHSTLQNWKNRSDYHICVFEKARMGRIKTLYLLIYVSKSPCPSYEQNMKDASACIIWKKIVQTNYFQPNSHFIHCLFTVWIAKDCIKRRCAQVIFYWEIPLESIWLILLVVAWTVTFRVKPIKTDFVIFRKLCYRHRIML